LTGKVKAPDIDKDDYTKMKESGAAGSLLTPQAAAGGAPAVNVRDMVRKIREDPVMLIKQKEKVKPPPIPTSPFLTPPRPRKHVRLFCPTPSCLRASKPN